MGKPTVMQEVRQLYCLYKFYIRENKKIVYLPIGGTKQKRWRMMKEAERYLEYARIDKEYAILDAAGYKQEVDIVNAIRTTILQYYQESKKEEEEN